MVNKISYFSLPNIVLDKKLAWLIGFYFAEGTKSKNTIGVSSKDLDLIEKTINIFEERLGVNKDFWRVFIKSNEKEDTRKSKIEAKWSKRLNKKVRINYGKLAYNECVDIRINSRELSKVFLSFFENSMAKMVKENHLAWGFLKGYFAGDGSVILRNKQIHSLVITSKNENYLSYLIEISKLLFRQKPNIRKTKGSYELAFCKVNIITEMVCNGVFKEPKRQWLKLIQGYKNKQYTRSRIKYWDKIKINSKNAYEIAQLSGNSHWAVRDALNKDIKNGLINYEYKHINNGGAPLKYYSLSHKCLNLIKKIKRC